MRMTATKKRGQPFPFRGRNYAASVLYYILYVRGTCVHKLLAISTFSRPPRRTYTRIYVLYIHIRFIYIHNIWVINQPPESVLIKNPLTANARALVDRYFVLSSAKTAEIFTPPEGNPQRRGSVCVFFFFSTSAFLRYENDDTISYLWINLTSVTNFVSEIHWVLYLHREDH